MSRALVGTVAGVELTKVAAFGSFALIHRCVLALPSRPLLPAAIAQGEAATKRTKCEAHKHGNPPDLHATSRGGVCGGVWTYRNLWLPRGWRSWAGRGCRFGEPFNARGGVIEHHCVLQEERRAEYKVNTAVGFGVGLAYAGVAYVIL